MHTIIFLVELRKDDLNTLLKRLIDTTGISEIKLSTNSQQLANEQEYYNFVSKEEWNHSEFSWDTDIDGTSYGIKKDQIIKLKSDHLGISVIPIDKVNVLEKIRIETDIEIVIVGINNSKIVENLQEIAKQFDIILSGNDEVIIKAIQCIINLLHNRGVLHKEAIISLLDAGTLLKNADINNNVQPASYDLRLGDMIWCKGNWFTLTREKPTAKIPPYSYIIVKALEDANFPKFIIGRYDLKLSLFFEGVTLSNGPQVDPGYQGGLLCLLFNASDKDVGINLDEHFATIEFLTTSKVTEGYSGPHQDKDEVSAFIEGTTAAGTGGTIVDRFEGLESSWLKYKNSIILLGLAFLTLILGAIYFCFNNLLEVKEITTIVNEQQSSIEKLLDDNKKLQSDTKREIEAFEGRMKK